MPERIHRLSELARRADEEGNLTSASATFNLAALIASDVGLPRLARQLCRRHSDLYLALRPLPGQAACYALEPLLNLANQYLREGRGGRAVQLLDDLDEAISSRSDIVIGDIPVPAATLTATDEAHRHVVEWMHHNRIVDGARALGRAGRWPEASARLRQAGLIGDRIFEGRQTAVIARAAQDDHAGATALLNHTVIEEAWERAVVSCLIVVCRTGGSARNGAAAVTAMLRDYQGIDETTEKPLFRTRLGLAVIDTSGIGSRAARTVAHNLIARTVNAQDGYTSRAVLAHPACGILMSDQQRDALTAVIDTSGLGAGRPLPADLAAELTDALDLAETVIVRTAGSGQADQR
ncbi:hypothetical protein [Kitasatospora nipponensis]|uniref:hypothetical protein n=1 Tax=Kitasatospora nipponensis TaxID=258049 RepID=UPI0031D5F93C